MISKVSQPAIADVWCRKQRATLFSFGIFVLIIACAQTP